MIKIGLIREEKIPLDKRVAFLPDQCKEITDRFPDVEIVVQSSVHRCVHDDEYRSAGFKIVDNVEDCDILFGIKEVPVESLIHGKTYLFFSHTIKKQPHNRKLLRAILKKKIRLIDYETLVWDNGTRVLGFGRYAGIVGTHNGLLTYGKKTDTFQLKPAWQCSNYEELRNEYLSVKIPPIKIALCGDGRVAHGSLELLNLIGIKEVTPHQFLYEKFNKPVYVHLEPEDFYAQKDGDVWDKSEFYHNPENFVSAFKNFSRVCDLMINAVYWNERIPRFFSKEDMKSRDFNIKVIADISCDINGAIPATLKDTSIEDPVYGYHPLSETIEPPFQKNTIDIMAVSNLPCELPIDASQGFGKQLLNYVIGPLLSHNNQTMISNATIADKGQLTARYQYLTDYVA